MSDRNTAGRDAEAREPAGGFVTRPSPREAMLDKVLAYFAANGVGDTSLRTLASGIGSSHRMLIYHFGSREGVLTAMVERTWRVQQGQLEELLLDSPDPYEGAWRFWEQLADDAAFAPLFFEMASAAMQGHDWAESLREWITSWTDRLAQFFVDVGHPPAKAAMLGRTAMAITRGVLFELALTGNRESADEVIHAFLGSTRVTASD